MAPVITSSEFMPGLQHVSWAMFSPENNFDVPLAFHPVSESASAVLFEKTILTASGLFVSVAKTLNGEILICMEPMKHATTNQQQVHNRAAQNYQ